MKILSFNVLWNSINTSDIRPSFRGLDLPVSSGPDKDTYEKQDNKTYNYDSKGTLKSIEQKLDEKTTGTVKIGSGRFIDNVEVKKNDNSASLIAHYSNRSIRETVETVGNFERRTSYNDYKKHDIDRILINEHLSDREPIIYEKDYKTDELTYDHERHTEIYNIEQMLSRACEGLRDFIEPLYEDAKKEDFYK